MDTNQKTSDHRSINICLVEDDLADAKAVRRALRKDYEANVVVHAMNGHEALDILRSATGPLSSRRVVLLDLNLPRMNGIEFLRVLRADQSISQTVVFVLTSSDDHRDIGDAFDHFVAGYFVKRGQESYDRVVRTLREYWDCGSLPPLPRSAVA